MANIKSINGNPIVVDGNGIADNSVTDAKLVQSGGVLETVGGLKPLCVEVGKSDAEVWRVNTNSTTESDSGTRLRVLFKLGAGFAFDAVCTAGSGTVVALYATKDNALKANTSYIAQWGDSSGNYTTDPLYGSYDTGGWLVASLKKQDSSAISDADRETLLAGLTISVRGGTVRDTAELRADVDALLPAFKVKTMILTKYGLNTNTGDEYPVNNRLHTPPFQVRGGDFVQVPDGYQYHVFFYNVTSYVGNTSSHHKDWLGGITRIDHDGLASIVIRKPDNSDFTADQCYALSNKLSLYSSTARPTHGILFEAGHPESSDSSTIWRQKGEDFYLYKWSDESHRKYHTNRIRSAGWVDVEKGTRFTVADGYRIHFYSWVEGGRPVASGWKTGEYVFGTDERVRIELDTTTDRSTPYTEWPDYSTVVEVVRPNEGPQGVIDTASLNADMETAIDAAVDFNHLASGDYDSYTTKRGNASFAVITDIHGSADAARRFVDYANGKARYIDAALCLGDSALRDPDDTSWLTAAIGRSEVPFWYTCGNHDISQTGMKSISEETARDKYFEAVEDGGWLESSDFMGEGRCSWTKDIDEHALRVISLYEYGNSEDLSGSAPLSHNRRWLPTDVLQWFADTLYSTPAGYSVVVLLHQVPYDGVSYVDGKFTAIHGYREEPPNFMNTVDGNPIEEIVDAFKHSTAISKTYSSIASYSLGKDATVSKDFSSRSEDGNFVCYIVGHAHTAYVLRSSNYPDQTTIVVNTGSESAFQRHYGDIGNDQSTRNMDCFYIVGIDTERKRVNLVQIGGQATLDMRRRDFDTIEY